MERGVKMLVRILATAGLLGLAVILLNPDYRGTVVSLFRGEVEESPIWQSNIDYYTEVSFEDGGDNEISE